MHKGAHAEANHKDVQKCTQCGERGSGRPRPRSQDTELVARVLNSLGCTGFEMSSPKQHSISRHAMVPVLSAAWWEAQAMRVFSAVQSLQLRALVVLAASCAALSCMAAAALLLFGWVIIPALLLCEVAVFPFVFWLKYRRLNAQPLIHAPHSSYSPRAVFDRFTRGQAKVSKYICIQAMMQKWFWDVPLSQVTKGNVADLLTYGFWYKSREQLEAEGEGHLPDQLVQELEEAWGVEFTPGYNKELPFMAHLWQDLRCHYRPLSFYLGIELLFALKHIMLLGIGFRSYSHRGYTFYTYGMELHSSSRVSRDGSNKTPILFLHGVGVGLLPYSPFLLRLAASGQPVVAVESNHLGMRWVSHCPAEDEVVDAVVEVMDQCKISAASVVSHSYGTFMASRLVQRFPQRVQSLVLIDPVCFCMFSGKLIHNFVYAPHKSAITTWFVARDIHHSASVCRNFFWSLLNLWPDQLPDKTLVVLSGQDELVPVQEAITMLKAESNAEILYHDHHNHAEFIKDLLWQDKVVANVVRLAKQGGTATINAGSEEQAITVSKPELQDLAAVPGAPASARPSPSAGQQGSATDRGNAVAAGEQAFKASAVKASGVKQRGSRPVQHGRGDSASSWQEDAASQVLPEQAQMCVMRAS